MNALTTVQRDRLVRVLGMLGSDHDGERASAGLHASRILKDAGMTWERLLSPMQQHQSLHRPPCRWLNKVASIIERRDEVTDWEFNFILGIARRPTLSAKQRAVLEQIYDKVAV